MIYLDSSALIKLIFEEPESDALVSWLVERPGVPKVSSQVSAIELARVCRRLDEGALPAARHVLAGLDLVPLAGEVIEQAALVGPPELRSLDAIHLASALVLGASLSAFVAYDARRATAAQAAGLTLAAPS